MPDMSDLTAGAIDTVTLTGTGGPRSESASVGVQIGRAIWPMGDSAATRFGRPSWSWAA